MLVLVVGEVSELEVQPNRSTKFVVRGDILCQIEKSQSRQISAALFGKHVLE
jgi:hypothetical protein